MEQLRRQTQLPLVFKGAVAAAADVSSGDGVVEKNKKKSKKKKKNKNKKDKKNHSVSLVSSEGVAQFMASAQSAPPTPRHASDVRWGLVVPVNWDTGPGGNESWDQATLQIGFNQSARHRNHRVCTIEMWVMCDSEEEAMNEVILVARGAGSQSIEHSAAANVARVHIQERDDDNDEDKKPSSRDDSSTVAMVIDAGVEGKKVKEAVASSVAKDMPWQWCLSLRPASETNALSKRLVFRTSGAADNIIEQPAPADPTSSDDEDANANADTAPVVVPHRWYHVCVVIDANRSNGSTHGKGEPASAFVSMYLNGRLASSGNVVEPKCAANITDATDPSLGLFVFPNATGWRLTEFRMWAAARPQHEVDAGKEWTLKLAKKTRGGKKRGGGLFKGVTIKAAVKPSATTTVSGGRSGRSGPLEVNSPEPGVSAPPELAKISLGGPAAPLGGGRRRRRKG